MLKGKWNKRLGIALCGALLFAAGCSAQATTVQPTTAEEEAPAQSEAETVQAAPQQQEIVTPAASPEITQSETAQAENAESAAQTAEPEAVQTAAPVAAQTASPTPAQKTATQAPAAAAQEQKAEATATPAAPAQAPAQTATLETALQYVGCDVAQLYAAIGQPSSAEYASSCMGDGEDGMLTYDTFTVTTYREGGVETVQDAY
jgi:hypothetical protein